MPIRKSGCGVPSIGCPEGLRREVDLNDFIRAGRWTLHGDAHWRCVWRHRIARARAGFSKQQRESSAVSHSTGSRSRLA